MRSVLAMAAAVVLTAILPHVTFAQGNQPRSQQPSQPVREQVKQTLEAAGFTDVQVMPESFLVRAKDPAGSPVIMVIDPEFLHGVLRTSEPTKQRLIAAVELRKHNNEPRPAAEPDRRQRENSG